MNTEVDAACPSLIDRMDAGGRVRLNATDRCGVRSMPQAVVGQPEAVAELHGFMRGSVLVPAGFDLTIPPSRSQL
jgi:hypothetical protein